MLSFDMNQINTQSTIVDLSTWTGNGIYFVHLIDASNNTIDIKKIILNNGELN